MHYHSEALIRDLSAKAQQFRIETLRMVYDGQTGHIGGAFSSAEILAALYFHHLKIDPARPDWPERDRLLLSKGHACAALYSAMAYRGFFPVEELMTFRKLDSRLQGHPDPSKLPGIEVCSGPLGHGVAVGVGMAFAQRMSVAKPSARSAAVEPGLGRQDLCRPRRRRDQLRHRVGRDDDRSQVQARQSLTPSWTTTASSRRRP